MKIVRYEDPSAFRDEVESYLRRDEARHNLMLGVLGTLIDRPEIYPEHDLRVVEEDGEPVGASLRTPPHNVIVSGPLASGAVETLASGWAAETLDLPGVVGALPEADLFAETYTEAVGGRIGARMDQAIHVLEAVEDVLVPPGAPREARPEDFDVLLPWWIAFHEEAGVGEHFDEEEVGRRLRHRLAEEGGGGIRIWEDGEPVCVVGAIPATASSKRVGPVFTPLEHRRRGYATALTAHVSREVLASGFRTCLLYTDLANPTSNAIYRKIGYVPVCDSAMISFERPSES